MRRGVNTSMTYFSTLCPCPAEDKSRQKGSKFHQSLPKLQNMQTKKDTDVSPSPTASRASKHANEHWRSSSNADDSLVKVRIETSATDADVRQHFINVRHQNRRKRNALLMTLF
jgi:hypothetical protein